MPKGRKNRDGVQESQMRSEGTKTIRRNTLSFYGEDLEEARRQLASKIETQVFSDNLKDKTKTQNYNKKRLNVFEEPEESSNPVGGLESKGRKSENVYAKYLHHGDQNLMLITEPLEASSQTCYKQIGNKTVVVHLNVTSNLCQLIDMEEKGIIPLDNKGEVWLEVKIRSKDSSSRSDSSSSTNASQHSVGKDRHPQEHDESQPNDPFKLNNPSVDNNFNNFNKQRSAAEHSDTCDTNVVEENIDDLYSTLSCLENDDTLQIKFEKGIDYRTLKMSEMSNFPLLSHQKVIEFLTNKSNFFDECDVSVCNWEYETESVYEDCVKIDSLLQFPWYHGNVEKALLRRRLTGKPQGSILVRRATGEEPSHMYTIDLIDEGNIKKLRIMKTSGQYHFKEPESHERFASVEDLVQTIIKSGLQIRDSRTGQWKTITVKPIQRE